MWDRLPSPWFILSCTLSLETNSRNLLQTWNFGLRFLKTWSLALTALSSHSFNCTHHITPRHFPIVPLSSWYSDNILKHVLLVVIDVWICLSCSTTKTKHQLQHIPPPEKYLLHAVYLGGATTFHGPSHDHPVGVSNSSLFMESLPRPSDQSGRPSAIPQPTIGILLWFSYCKGHTTNGNQQNNRHFGIMTNQRASTGLRIEIHV